MGEPLPICYLNGTFLPWDEARLSPFDRGFLYGDGAYELMPVYGGRPFRFEAHCARLARSLQELRMSDPLSRESWRGVVGGLIERNGGGEQYVYWQVTRGAERGRNHAPLPEIERTVFAFCAPLPLPSAQTLERGIACISTADTRWARCDIKSIALLANVLLRQLALDANAAEAILLRDGELTEASSSAVHVVIDGEVRTPPHSKRLLPGTTRGVLEELAQRASIPYRIARVTESELREAQEIFLSAATRELVPVTQLDARSVGSGRPGAVWRALYAEFQRYKRELSGQPW
jgi:D-alanine transaminase